MPLYEYECPACGSDFEKRSSISESDSQSCPHCGSSYTKLKMSKISVKGQSSNAGSSAPVFTGGSL
jgi:putative FmdB family regulatory protein